MITITVPFDNPLNQKTYENLINTLQFHQLQCTCGHSGCLTIHGYYPRSLKENDSEITLSICRVKCSHCGKTHALLPSQLVPYSQVSLQEQAAIISAYEDSGDFKQIMDRTPSKTFLILRASLSLLLISYCLLWMFSTYEIISLSVFPKFIWNIHKNYVKKILAKCNIILYFVASIIQDY